MMADPFSASMRSNSLVASVQWIETAMTGSVAMSIAVIAVATTGLAMLSGRTDLRRGAATILGCFIVFGSASLASGLLNLATGQEQIVAVREGAPTPMEPRDGIRRVAPPQAFDPYAGAAMPVN